MNNERPNASDVRRIRAYREAARGILTVVHARGFPTLILDDEPTGASLVRLRPGEQMGWRCTPWEVVERQTAEILLAPIVAETLLTGNLPAADRDYARAVRCLTRDLERRTTRRTSHAVLASWEAVRRYLEDGWETVTVLAERLLAQGSVPAREVWAVVAPDSLEGLEEIAYRQAGEVVMALLGGCQIWYVTILPDGDVVSCMDWGPSDGKQGLAVHVAGAYARARYAVGRDEGAVGPCFHALLRRANGLTEGRPLELPADVLTLVEDELDRHWHLVEGMARELLRHHTLSAGQVRDAFTELGGRVSTGARYGDEERGALDA